MTARRALSADAIDAMVDKSTAPRRASIVGSVAAPIESTTAQFVRPRRVALPSVEEDAIVPLARCISAKTTMSLPVIDVDSVHAAKSPRTRRRVSLPAAAVAGISALGLGVSLLPQTVAAAPEDGSADARQTSSVARDASRTDLTVDLSSENAAAGSDSLAALGRDAATQAAANKAAADQAVAEQAAAAAAANSTAAKTTKSTATAGTANSAAAQAAVNYAMAQVGKPYGWGSVGPDAFDCSGLTMAAYASAGISLPRVTYGQKSAGASVDISNLAVGDLVFFYGVEHVGIYIGNGQVVHAADYGTGVVVSAMSSMPFAGATRVA